MSLGCCCVCLDVCVVRGQIHSLFAPAQLFQGEQILTQSGSDYPLIWQTLDFFRSDISTIWARTGFVPFGANFTHFVPKLVTLRSFVYSEWRDVANCRLKATTTTWLQDLIQLNYHQIGQISNAINSVSRRPTLLLRSANVTHWS